MLGGVLSHVIDNIERPISFASRSLSTSESNCSQLDREALAVMFSINHFFMYLFGQKFTLITDNNPLTRIFHPTSKLPAMTSARLLRYAVFLSGFNYDIKYKRGVEHTSIEQTKISTDMILNQEVSQLCFSSIHEITTLDLTTESITQIFSKNKNT